MEEFTKDELLERLRNSAETAAWCSGYLKTQRNAQVTADYSKELADRFNYEVTAVDLVGGAFNGVGSW